MSMTKTQLIDLRSRCFRACQRGYGVARVGSYAASLGGTGDETQPTELLALCDAALAGKPVKKAAPAKPAPVKKAAKKSVKKVVAKKASKKAEPAKKASPPKKVEEAPKAESADKQATSEDS